MNFCKYGCGREGKYKIKIGGWCCSKSHNICPANKEKNRQNKLGSKNPMYGKPITEDHREKLRKASTGRKHSKKTIRKMRVAQLGEKHPMWGKHHSKETKKKMRKAAIKYRKTLIDRLQPNYNKDACKLIEKFGRKHGYQFQHAENGGEFFIEELGYWVDGYDWNKNVVIEVDEKHHFDLQGNLSYHDIKRQGEIENFLQCKFIRIKI